MESFEESDNSHNNVSESKRSHKSKSSTLTYKSRSSLKSVYSKSSEESDNDGNENEKSQFSHASKSLTLKRKSRRSHKAVNYVELSQESSNDPSDRSSSEDSVIILSDRDDKTKKHKQKETETNWSKKEKRTRNSKIKEKVYVKFNCEDNFSSDHSENIHRQKEIQTKTSSKRKALQSISESSESDRDETIKKPKQKQTETNLSKKDKRTRNSNIKEKVYVESNGEDSYSSDHSENIHRRKKIQFKTSAKRKTSHSDLRSNESDSDDRIKKHKQKESLKQTEMNLGKKYKQTRNSKIKEKIYVESNSEDSYSSDNSENIYRRKKIQTKTSSKREALQSILESSESDRDEKIKKHKQKESLKQTETDVSKKDKRTRNSKIKEKVYVESDSENSYSSDNSENIHRQKKIHTKISAKRKTSHSDSRSNESDSDKRIKKHKQKESLKQTGTHLSKKDKGTRNSKINEKVYVESNGEDSYSSDHSENIHRLKKIQIKASAKHKALHYVSESSDSDSNDMMKQKNKGAKENTQNNKSNETNDEFNFKNKRLVRSKIVKYVFNSGESDLSETDDLHKNKCLSASRAEVKSTACNKCGTAFNTHLQLTNHLRLVHYSKPQKCAICSESFRHYHSYIFHMKSFHPEVERYPCKYMKCTLSFHTVKQLRDHEKSHYKYVCRYCKKAYAMKISMLEHVNKVHF